MSDIQTDFNAILADFAKSSLGGDNTPTTVEAPAATVAQPTDTPTVPDANPTPTAVEAPKAVEVKPEENKPVVEPEGPVSDWDTTGITPTTPEVTPTTGSLPVEVFNELGKVLGLEKVQGKEDVVAAITALKAEAEKTKGFDKTQIHPELQKAIELNQKGGDFYEYLKVTSVDYSKADPVTLYEDYVIDSFADANGNVDEDKVNNFLDNLPDAEKELRGKELQRRLVADQRAKVTAIENEAILKKQKNDAELKAALSGLTEVDGFKVDDTHRRDIFEWVTGKMMKDLFYGPDGSLDPQKVAKVAFRNKYHDKLDSYYKNKIRNTTKREILADITNAQITSPSAPAAPGPKKGYDISDYINSLEQKLVNR